MKRTHAFETISKFREMFSVFGLPDEIVSDNGPPFNSFDFKEFCDSNGIKLSHSPPYHPQSNGEAEVAVRVAKQTLKKMIIDASTKTTPIELKLAQFLLKYRTTPTIATGKTPVSLLFNFKPKTKLDLVNKRIVREANTSLEHNTQRKEKTESVKNLIEKKIDKFEINEIVSYQIVWNNFVKWVPAKVIGKISDRVYAVSVNGASKTAHLRQLRKTKASNLSEWPGVFEHNNVENNSNCDNIVHRENNKRPRPPNSPDFESNEIRRSERIAKKPRRCYKE